VTFSHQEAAARRSDSAVDRQVGGSHRTTAGGRPPRGG
jgi:hypothetical protein